MKRLTTTTGTARLAAARGATILAVIAWGAGSLGFLGGAGMPTYQWATKAIMVSDLTAMKEQAARFAYQNGEGRSVQETMTVAHAPQVTVPDTALGQAYMTVVPKVGDWTINTDGTVTYRSTLPHTDICLTMTVTPAAPAGFPGGGSNGDANTEVATITDCGSDTLTETGPGLTEDGHIAGDTSATVPADAVTQTLTDAGLTTP